MVYRKFPTMLANIDNRVDSFYHELGLVQDLEKQGKATTYQTIQRLWSYQVKRHL
ncbi:MAG: hypothetical protein ACOX1L_09310 [Erysipelotrichaceae bacterium]